MGTTYTTSRTSRQIGKLSKIHAKITFQDQLTAKDSHTHRPQRNLSSGMRTVRPAQPVVPVAEEYRSRV